jgi:uncharacterized cofD-like protein
MTINFKKPKKVFAFLTPGLKLKRWIAACFAGLAVSFLAVSRFTVASDPFEKNMLLVAIVLGLAIAVEGIRSLIASLLEAVAPGQRAPIIDTIYQERLLDKGPKIVAIGGGTGLSTMLSGIKNVSRNVTAIVTVADDGGSSGRLRRDFDILPPGDLRNCIAALADETDLMRKLFQYRFDKGEGVAGHSFGNLFITAMREITGSFDAAIKESSKILAIRGRVLPASLESLHIKAEFYDGSFVEGEAAIPEKHMPIKRLMLVPDNATANPEAVQAIKEADLVIIGPGSVYTSVLPNLLIDGIRQALEESSAFKVYICNIMTQHGETDGYTASKHMKVLVEHASTKVFSHCVVNHAACDTATLLKYAKEHSFPVIPDKERIEQMGLSVVVGDLICEDKYIRHDPAKLAKVIAEAFGEWKKNKNATNTVA